MHIKLLTTIEEIAATKSDWNSLYNKTSEGPFIHHSWVLFHYQTFEQPPLVVVVYNDDKTLIGAFPFSIKPFKIKAFTFHAICHGIDRATDYSLFLIDPSANSRLIIKRVIQFLMEQQESRWDVYKFDNLSDANINASLFRHFLLKELYGCETVAEITPVIEFSRIYEEPKKASNIKRRFRKIADNCVFEHKQGCEISAQDMAEFSDIHRLSFPNSAFDAQKTQKFYRAILDDSSFGSHAILSTIKIDNKLVAAHFGFMDDDIFYYYVPTYDEKYAQYGAGQFLLRSLVEMAKKKGCSSFDLLRGSEDYKYNWTNRVNNNYSLLAIRKDAPALKKILINFWILTKALPFFNH